MKPYQVINRDLKAISEIAIMALQFVPENQLQVLSERKIKKILSRYYSKKRQYPKFRSL
jgi:DNA-directed RNA polymerase subunit H (RpoH/RPB5)